MASGLALKRAQWYSHGVFILVSVGSHSSVLISFFFHDCKIVTRSYKILSGWNTQRKKCQSHCCGIPCRSLIGLDWVVSLSINLSSWFREWETLISLDLVFFSIMNPRYTDWLRRMGCKSVFSYLEKRKWMSSGKTNWRHVIHHFHGRCW